MVISWQSCGSQSLLSFFFSSSEDILIDFRERGRAGRKRERNIDWLPLVRAPARGPSCNLGMCFDQESKPQPFTVQDSIPANWATLARAGSPSWLVSIIILLSWGSLCPSSSLYCLLQASLPFSESVLLATLHSSLCFSLKSFQLFTASLPCYTECLIGHPCPCHYQVLF